MEEDEGNDHFADCSGNYPTNEIPDHAPGIGAYIQRCSSCNETGVPKREAEGKEEDEEHVESGRRARAEHGNHLFCDPYGYRCDHCGDEAGNERSPESHFKILDFLLHREKAGGEDRSPLFLRVVVFDVRDGIDDTPRMGFRLDRLYRYDVAGSASALIRHGSLLKKSQGPENWRSV